MGLALVSLGDPSPKVHSYDATVPSGSLVPAEEKATARGAVPFFGVAPALATGGRLLAEVAVICFVIEPVKPELSVTVSLAVYTPGAP